MPEILRCRFLFLTAVLIISALQSSYPAEEKEQRLVSPTLLEHAGLEIVWENVLPTKRDESLEKLLVLGDHVYAISNKNYMLCLERENGNRIFGEIVAPGGVKIEDLSLYNDNLLCVVGSKLFEIDPNTGIERNSVDAGVAIVCPAARNSSYYYFSGVDERLHVLRADNMVKMFDVAAMNNSMITTIVADEAFVVFGTDKGNIISITPDLPKRLWQFDASAAIAGQIVQDGLSLFFASEDMNVYRIDIVGLPERRRLIWKYLTDGVLKTAPRVTSGVVYQCVYLKDLIAIEKNSGSFMWSVPGGVGLLTEAKDKAYVITRDSTLVVMSNIERKKLYTVNFAGVSKYATNLADSKIYIADKSGRIACLQPLN
jgi:outer membrane protein assembly factor BamB